MALERPTLQEIKERVEADIAGVVGITTFLTRTFWRGLAAAISGTAHLIYGFLVYLSEQLFADISEKEFLTRQASVYDFQRKEATYAELNVTFVGTDGITVTQGKELQSSTGLLYVVQDDVVIAGGSVAGIAVAENANTDEINYNLGDDSKLSFVSPIADVDQEVNVDSTLIQAASEEGDDDFRARFLEFLRDPPAGGKASDYIMWMKEVAGVTRAWVFPLWTGNGTVGNTFVQDDEFPIIPGAPKIAEVDAYLRTKAPITAIPGLTTFAPNADPLDLTIKLEPNTVAVQAEVTAELQDLIFREANPKGSWKNGLETYDGIIKISKLREAVSRATGEEDNQIVTPTVDVEPVADNDLVTLGDITFQDF